MDSAHTGSTQHDNANLSPTPASCTRYAQARGRLRAPGVTQTVTVEAGQANQRSASARQDAERKEVEAGQEAAEQVKQTRQRSAATVVVAATATKQGRGTAQEAAGEERGEPARAGRRREKLKLKREKVETAEEAARAETERVSNVEQRRKQTATKFEKSKMRRKKKKLMKAMKDADEMEMKADVSLVEKN